MRRVLLEGRASGWDLHSLYNEFLCFPPNGYEFTVTNKNITPQSENIIHSLNKHIVANQTTKMVYDHFRPLAYYLYNRLNDRSVDENFDLIYASQHIILRKFPWVVDLEHAGALVAYGKPYLIGKIIERYLESNYCKKILPWTEMGKKSLLSSFRCRGFEEKIEVVNLAVRPKNFDKTFNNHKIRLMFLGTANRINIKDSFAIKGGNEVFRAFELLRKDHKELELVVRSSVPADIKKKYTNFEDVRILDTPIPWKMLDYEFQNADIFLFPAHSTPGMAILDAMSYELPVITTDVWANKELVEDGRTGFLINGSSDIRYYDSSFVPLWGEPKFMRAIHHIDLKVVKDLVEKTSILIDDAKLRRKMGKAGRQEIETGKFSIEKRNEKLKRIFNEALECGD